MDRRLAVRNSDNIAKSDNSMSEPVAASGLCGRRCSAVIYTNVLNKGTLSLEMTHDKD